MSDRRGSHLPIKYRPDVDGLRAIAIFSVVAYHAGLRWAGGGFVGVDVFFVISGYLIGSLVYKEIRSGSFTASKFYARRARRILPALIVVLFFCYACALLMLPPLELERFSSSALSTIASGSNFYFWKAVDYFHRDSSRSPLLMTWTLGVEEQFYFLFPLLMLAMRKLRWQTQFAGIAGLSAISLAALVLSAASHPAPAFYLLPMRAWELGAGVMLAILEASRAQAQAERSRLVAHCVGIAGMALIVSALVIPAFRNWFPGFAALPAVAGAVMILGARDGVVNRALALRPMVFIGLVSYSWYLWHWPMFSFVQIVLNSKGSAWVGVGIGCLSFAFAVLSYWFVERPFRASMTPAPQLLRRYAAVLVVAALPAAAFCAMKGLPERNRAAQAVEEASTQSQSDPCLTQSTNDDPIDKAQCVPPGSGPALALIGDSHAASIAAPLRAISAHSGYRLIQLTKADCMALEGVSAPYAGAEEFAEGCGRFNRERIDFIERDASVRIVIVAGYWSSEIGPDFYEEGLRVTNENSNSEKLSEMRTNLQLGLSALVERLQHDGKIVYLVEDNPRFPFDPVQVMYNRLFAARAVLAGVVSAPTITYANGVAPDFNPESVREMNGMVGAVAAAHPGTRVIDLRAELCNGSGCRFTEGDHTLYADYTHLTPLGAGIALARFDLK